MEISQEQIINAVTGRLRQRRFGAGAANSRGFGNIIQRVSTISEGSATVPNGSEVIFTATVTAVNGNRLLVNIDRATYIGSVAAGNEIGPGIAISNYPSFGPYYSLRATDGNNIVQKHVIHNGSGVQQTIISDIQTRFIINFGGASK